MKNIYETINRKFIDSIEVSEWEIETDTGWEEITHINKTIPYIVYEIIFSNSIKILCADNHIFIGENYEQIFAKDSLNKIIISNNGLVKVTSVINLGYEENMYDVTVNSNNHTYFGNGILSHNTQVSAGCILHYTLFNKSKTVAILANKAAVAREILLRYQEMYEMLPLWMQSGIREWNKGSLILENGCKIFTAATTPSGIRGRSVNWLYIDETAIIPNNVADAFFAATYPVIMAGTTTKVLLSSTPLGYNHFWKYWNEAEQGLNGFTPLFIPYTRHPDRGQAWADEQLAILGEVKFNQEVLCSFIGSNFCLFNADTLSRLSHKQFIYSKDNLDILEEPKRGDLDETGKQISPDHAYVLIADTSRGVGGDYSAFVVIDITELPYTVVAKYRDNKVTPLLYPSIIHTVAKNYNNAYILVEVNDNGQQIADILYNDLEYENMIWINREGVRGQVASAGFKGGTKQCGVRTDKKVKRIGCTHLKTLVEGQKLLVWDSDIISEFSTFIEHKDSYAADEGYHDDLVMPLVLFGWLTTNPFFSDLTNINIREKMYDMQIKQIEDELTPFGFIDYGITDEEKKYFIQDGDLWSIMTERDPSILS